MLEGMTVVRKCDSPPEVCQLMSVEEVLGAVGSCDSYQKV